MIRKAISCDICGTEMLNANHWFAARESGSELRITAWNGHNQVRGSCRHLCGHKCLHRLLDDFMARAQQSGPIPSEKRPDSAAISRRIDTSRASRAVLPAPHLPVIASCAAEPESTARLVTSPQPFGERTPPHRLYAEAWKRERERQQRLTHNRSIA